MRFFFVLILSLLISSQSFAAGNDDDTTLVKPTDYKKAVNLIKKHSFKEAISILESILSKSKYQKDPDILNDGVELTEEQKEHRRIRQILDDKNEAFNNRMKVNRSIKKLQERQKIKSI